MLSDGDSVAVNRALGEAGWIGMSWPVELGGRGLSRLTATLVEEVFGYHWLPLSSYLLSYKTIGAAIERFGSPALVEALLAGIAAGLLAPDTSWSRAERVVEPDPANRQRYDELYDAFVKTYKATRPIYRRLNAATRSPA